MPTYSPDPDPLEEAFAKLKAYLRRSQAHTQEALVRTIGRALDKISSQDAQGFSLHADYSKSSEPP
jgi:transposase